MITEPTLFDQPAVSVRRQVRKKVKEAVMDFYEAARMSYIHDTRDKLITWAKEHPEEHISADVIHAIAPPPTFQKDGIDSRIVGSVLKCNSFQCIGYKKSARTKCHHRPIGLFVYVGTAQ